MQYADEAQCHHGFPDIQILGHSASNEEEKYSSDSRADDLDPIDDLRQDESHITSD